MSTSLSERRKQATNRVKHMQDQGNAILGQLQGLINGHATSVVLGHGPSIHNALRILLSAYDLPIPAQFHADLELQQVEDLLSGAGLIGRKISVPQDWKNHDYGVVLFIDSENKTWVAQRGLRSYKLVNGSGDEVITHDDFIQDKRAYVIYPKLPGRALSMKEWLLFGNSWLKAEITMFSLFTLLTSLFAMALPLLTAQIINEIVPDNDYNLLYQLGLLLVFVVCFQGLASYFASWLQLRLETKSSLFLQAALIDRVMAYATKSKLSATRMAMQVQFATGLRQGMNAFATTGFTGLSYLLAAIGVMFIYEPAGSAFVFLTMLIILCILIFLGWSGMKILREGQRQDINNADKLFDIMSNLTVIRAFGLERQFFAT